MKIDNESLAIEIVYGSILETMSKLLRDCKKNCASEIDYGEFEAVHDGLAEAIENLMGLEIRGGAAASRMKRLVKDGCFKNTNPVTAVWMLHEAISCETLTDRVMDEITMAGDQGAWDCASTRSVAKARSILDAVVCQRAEHEDRAKRMQATTDDAPLYAATADVVLIYDVGQLAYAA